MEATRGNGYAPVRGVLAMMMMMMTGLPGSASCAAAGICIQSNCLNPE